MKRAALDRHAVPDGGDGLVEPRRAVDDEELGPSDKPRLMRSSRTVRQASVLFAAHALDREQHLLAVLAYAKDGQGARRKSLCGSSRTRTTAVENEPHDRFFGKRAGVPRVPVGLHLTPTRLTVSLPTASPNRQGERAAHPACVGAGEVGARDQRVGNKRAPLIGRSAVLFHSVVLPSGVFSLARGTSISTRPKLPSSRPRPVAGGGDPERHRPPSLLRRSATSYGEHSAAATAPCRARPRSWHG